MLIACKFKRPNAPVEIDDATYYFRPIDPANADSEHVAEVSNNAHIQRLMGIPEAYYIAQAQALPTAPKPTLVAVDTITGTPAVDGADQGINSAAPVVDQPPADGQAPQGSNDVVPLPEELQEQARNLNELSWQGLQAQLKQGGIAPAVIKAALDIEKAKPEADQRATTLKLLGKALEA